MRDHRVALAQIAPALGAIERNRSLHLEFIEKARHAGAHRVVFPELSLTGYHLLDQAPEVALTTADAFWEPIAAASRDLDVILGFVEQTHDYKFCNSMAYFRRGRLHHVQRKLNLPTYGMFQEGREFAAGERLRAFDAGDARLGILICEDLWHVTNAFLLAQDGADCIIGPSNSPSRGAKPERGIGSLLVWRELLQVMAQFQTCYVVYVNRVGNEDGLNFGGGSFVVDPFGRVVDGLPGLEEGLLCIDLQAEVLRRSRTAYPLLRDERLDLVQRELERIRRRRYGLEQTGNAAETEPIP